MQDGKFMHLREKAKRNRIKQFFYKRMDETI